MDLVGCAALPPERALSLIDAAQAWVAEHCAAGRIHALWSFAGMIGAVGVAEVESPDELDEMMTSFPFPSLSNVEVIALSDMDRNVANGKAQMERMMAMMGRSSRRPRSSPSTRELAGVRCLAFARAIHGRFTLPPARSKTSMSLRPQTPVGDVESTPRPPGRRRRTGCRPWPWHSRSCPARLLIGERGWRS